MIKVDKGGGGGVKNVWILVDVNKERSLSTKGNGNINALRYQQQALQLDLMPFLNTHDR